MKHLCKALIKGATYFVMGVGCLVLAMLILVDMAYCWLKGIKLDE